MFYALLYGENSEEYKEKELLYKNFTSCNFKEFSKNYDDIETAKKDFKLKYGSMNLENIMYKNNCDEEQARKIRNERLEKSKITYNKKTQDEKNIINSRKGLSLENFIKKYGETLGTEKYNQLLEIRKNTGTIDYYIKKYGEEEGKKLFYEKRICNTHWRKEYWIKRGYSEIEAENILTKLFEDRPSFSKKYCIEKYGYKKGIMIWKERQKIWQKTLQNKSKDEIERINRSKGINLENYVKKYGIEEGTKKYNNWRENYIPNNSFSSKEASKFFIKLYRKLRKLGIIENKSEVHFAVRGSQEKFIYSKNNKKLFFYDFCIPKLKIIIEYHGIAWHPKKDDLLWTPIFDGKTRDEIYEYDKLKESVAIDSGFDYHVVWSDEQLDQKMLEFAHIILERFDDYAN